MNDRIRISLLLGALLTTGTIVEASAPPDAGAPVAPAGARCGNVAGAWSVVVTGLRARLITSDSRPDHASLRVEIEIENLDADDREIHWNGRPDIGFLRFFLTDNAGASISADNMIMAGSEIGAPMRLLLAGHHAIRLPVTPNAFEAVGGTRRIRIGAFWARPMPADGSHRLFGVRVAGAPTAPRDESLLELDEHGATRVVRPSRRAARGELWQEAIDVPAVCVD